MKINVLDHNFIPAGMNYRLDSKHLDGIVRRNLRFNLLVQQQPMYETIKNFVKEVFNG